MHCVLSDFLFLHFALSFLFQMVQNMEPLMLSADAPLAYNAAQAWLSKEYLHVQMGPPQTMVQHLCTFLSVTEIELHEGVHSQLVRHMQVLAKVCEQWF